MAERLGEIFLRKKLITIEQLEKALQEQTRTGEYLGEILVRSNYVTEENVLEALAEQFDTQFILLDKTYINPYVINLVPRDLILEYKFMPLDLHEKVMLIAVSNPLEFWLRSVLQERLHLSGVQILLAKKKDILGTLQKFYSVEVTGDKE